MANISMSSQIHGIKAEYLSIHYLGPCDSWVLRVEEPATVGILSLHFTKLSDISEIIVRLVTEIGRVQIDMVHAAHTPLELTEPELVA